MAFDNSHLPEQTPDGEFAAPPKRANAPTGPIRKPIALWTGTSGIALLLSTGFGIGYSPLAPGTLGAALGVGIYSALWRLGALRITVPLVSAVLLAAGVHLASIAERRFGEKDSPKIVLDEVASFPLTMLFISPTWPRIAFAFAFHRAADILKPFPAGRIQKLKGGWGIMLDDTMAAIYANLLLRLAILVLRI